MRFYKGDIVRISKTAQTLQQCKGKTAVVLGSYKDLYGGRAVGDYSLDVQGFGHVSWFEAKDLKLVFRQRNCLCCGQEIPK